MTLLDEVRLLFGSSNLYDVLGVENTANGDEIKRAYHLLSLKVHPDRFNEQHDKEDYTTKFQLLTQIYLILSDNDRRLAYDEHNYGGAFNIGTGSFSEPKRESDYYKFKKNKFKAEDSIIQDEIPLSLLDYNQSTNLYTYECRCSGNFIIEEETIRRLSAPSLAKKVNPNNEVFVIVDCESCSLRLKVCV